jgi:two-component sensor histidine kinase
VGRRAERELLQTIFDRFPMMLTMYEPGHPCHRPGDCYQTVRRANSPHEFATSFSGRLQALARTHSLLTDTTWQGADLLALVRDQLRLGSSEDERISYFGPSVRLPPQTALHLALVLHELGTNARKYGALSTSPGKLSVHWQLRGNEHQELLLQWREHNGHPIAFITGYTRAALPAAVSQC